MNGMAGRIMNITCVIVGISVIALSAGLFSRHQYAVLRSRIPVPDDPKMWIPTVVLLLADIWLSVFGIVGLVDKKRGTKRESE
jgi:hypothetical protein